MKIPSSSSFFLATLAISSSSSSLSAFAAPTGDGNSGMTPSSSFHNSHARHMSSHAARAVPPDELEERARLADRALLSGPLAPVCDLLHGLLPVLDPITNALCDKKKAGTASTKSVDDVNAQSEDGMYDAESDDMSELRAAVATVSSMMAAAGMPNVARKMDLHPRHRRLVCAGSR
ncbi:hypothetical protein BD626DRAFT_80514 [Schizophyllum amplum]|uniref:Uncharacterized protein n=1 Tax=Schizophyllum amplum TaxID=97359 RepID=A0A550C9Y1_9AGAR|nr:hypothetical protein BD626DRAFT_80514 [Auriculariopsis ampla]